MNEAVSVTANLLGDPGRAAMLLSLMGGVSRPAGELAQVANVAPQTASAHLAKLVDGRLLTVERQGRHRYYRLADGDVADAIESLLVLTERSHGAGAAHRKPPLEASPTRVPATRISLAGSVSGSPRRSKSAI